MGLFSKKRKKSAEDNISLSNIDFECLYKAHMPPVTVSENPDAVQICPTCENPMYPGFLAKVILTGVFEERELNQTELGNCATILPFLFWAQQNLQTKPFVIQGIASSEVRASATIPIEAAIQKDMEETLESLVSFGSQELGDAEDVKMLLVLGRSFLQWTISDDSKDGVKQVSIEPLAHFAVLNSKNFEALQKLVAQVSRQLGWATWDRYMDFFVRQITRELEGSRDQSVFEVKLHFQVVAETQDVCLIAEEPNKSEIDLLRANVLPILASNRAPTNLVGPVALEIETQLDAFKTANSCDGDGEEQENFELEFETYIKFLIISEKEIGDTESELRSLLQNNLNLAIYFETSSKNLSWGYLNDESAPVANLDLLDLQMISFGSEAIKVTVKHLNNDEASKSLEGTPWRI